MVSESLKIGITDDDEIYQFALSRIISQNKLDKGQISAVLGEDSCFEITFKR